MVKLIPHLHDKTGSVSTCHVLFSQICEFLCYKLLPSQGDVCFTSDCHALVEPACRALIEPALLCKEDIGEMLVMLPR